METIYLRMLDCQNVKQCKFRHYLNARSCALQNKTSLRQFKYAIRVLKNLFDNLFYAFQKLHDGYDNAYLATNSHVVFLLPLAHCSVYIQDCSEVPKMT